MPMPKPKFENPLTMTTGSVFDISKWLGGILFVVMFGMIVAMGTKVLSIVDNKLPGNQTPSGVPGYSQPIINNGFPVR